MTRELQIGDIIHFDSRISGPIYGKVLSLNDEHNMHWIAQVRWTDKPSDFTNEYRDLDTDDFKFICNLNEIKDEQDLFKIKLKYGVDLTTVIDILD